VSTTPVDVPSRPCSGVDTSTSAEHCGGTCGPACAATLLATGPQWPLFIELTATDVLWITGGNDGAVLRMPIGGGASTTLATGQSWPAGFAVDDTHVYWAAASRIRKMPLEGGAVTDLVTTQMNPKALAVRDGVVYFADYGDGDVTRIMTVPVDGGDPVTLATEDSSSPAAIAVDATRVYWANGYSGTQRHVLSVPLSGGEPTALALGDYSVFGLGIDSENVYFTTFQTGVSSVRKVPLGGGAETTLASGTAQPLWLAVSAHDVYWTNASSAYTLGGLFPATDGTVLRVPKAGGATETIAPAERDPSGVAATGQMACWVDYGDGTVHCLGVCDDGSCP
jgi:hypothetical protein